MKEEQYSYFKELLAQVTSWQSSMERRVDGLESVAMDMSLIENQIEALQVGGALNYTWSLWAVLGLCPCLILITVSRLALFST